jgi:DNA-binding beta-propeller fold protein YncE
VRHHGKGCGWYTGAETRAFVDNLKTVAAATRRTKQLRKAATNAPPSATRSRSTVDREGGGVAITPDGEHAYLIGGGFSDGTVKVIETATGVVSAPIPVGQEAIAVAICPA